MADDTAWMPEQPAAVRGPAGGAPLLPGYRDFVLIARSDSSEVYRARQVGVDRPVAIKVLLLDDREAIARFEREISITVTIGRQHPHIVTVIETGTTTTNRPCIVMEYYDHGSLQDRLRSTGPLPWEEVLAAGTVVADALSFAHRHGVLHRDIKPQNILVLPTSYVVADFGIARPINAGHTSSVEWFSFYHASPETLEAERPAVTDDIWSVGSTLFTLLDGRPPFATGIAEEDTALAYMRRVRTGRPRRLARPDVPPGLAEIIDRCMRRAPAERFPAAASLHQALQALAGQIRAWAPPGSAPAATAPRPAPVPVSPPPAPAPPPVPPGPPAPVSPPASVPPRPAPTTTGARPPAPRPVPPPDLATTGTRQTGGATMPGVLPPAAMASILASAASGYATNEDTGTGTETYTQDYHVPTSPGSRPPRRGARIALVAVGAVVVGAVVGLGGTLVAQLARTEAADTPTPAPTRAVTPAAQSPTPPPATTSAPPQSPNINNPAIAPQITAVTQTGSSVLVEWQDATDGVAQFIVVRVVDGTGEPVRAMPPGITEVVIDGLDEASGPHCFLVIAVVGSDRGVSTTRCTND